MMNNLRYNKAVLIRSMILCGALIFTGVSNAQFLDNQVVTKTFSAEPPEKSVVIKTFGAVNTPSDKVTKKTMAFNAESDNNDKAIMLARNDAQTKLVVEKSQADAKSYAPVEAGSTFGSNKRISLNFQNIKTRQLLQLLAKTSNLNFIISENVNSSMTLHLKNVPWREALKIILQSNGLDSRQIGEVILIAPIQELADNEINALTARQKVDQLAPLHSEILQFNYASASDIAALLKSQGNAIMTPRGQVGVDTRTNSLWLRDLPSNITEIKHFVKQLDIPAKQVLIEARIVSIDKNFTRDLGVRFGVSRPGRLSGKLLQADGSSSFTDPVAAIADRLIFNIPSSLKSAGSLAVSLIRLDNKNFLDLELSALEKEGHAETISSPRIITSNQKEALIEKGEEIPYLTASSSGSTSVEFKKAVLSLKITPQITNDRNIILQMKVTQDTKGEQLQTTAGQFLPPGINTKQVESFVFLHNGQTVVVGGIYERTLSDDVQRIPFLGKIPVVGYLFSQKVVIDNQTELLVFITPRIIDTNYRSHQFTMGEHKCCDTNGYRNIRKF